MIASVFGGGFIDFAVSKNPAEYACLAWADGPAGIIPKNLEYLKSAFTAKANSVMNMRLCAMTIGIAGTVMFVPYPDTTISTLSTSSSLL